jgi:hypothetical protein
MSILIRYSTMPAHFVIFVYNTRFCADCLATLLKIYSNCPTIIFQVKRNKSFWKWWCSCFLFDSSNNHGSVSSAYKRRDDLVTIVGALSLLKGTVIDLTARIREHLATNPDCANQPRFAAWRRQLLLRATHRVCHQNLRLQCSRI